MLKVTKAVKKQIKLRAAITGPTGGGKTYTALRLGLALGKKVLVIDTERQSARKYADESPDGRKWDYDVIELPDFSPSTYTEAIKLGTNAGYDIIIIDSLSHAWEGENGILELQQKYGGRYQDWAKVNPLHFGLINAILSAPCHMIVTMRSKMEYALDTVEDGKGNKRTQVTKIGMSPIQRSGVQYEFDFILDMDNANIGRVDKTRCSSMRGQTAAMPGPGFFQPLIDWLNSGDMADLTEQPQPVALQAWLRLRNQAGDMADLTEQPQPEATPQPRPPQPVKPQTEQKPEPTDNPKAQPNWSKPCWDFMIEVEQATDNHWQGNGWHFQNSMKKLGLSWSILNNHDSRQSALSTMVDYYARKGDDA